MFFSLDDISGKLISTVNNGVTVHCLTPSAVLYKIDTPKMLKTISTDIAQGLGLGLGLGLGYQYFCRSGSGWKDMCM